MLKELKQVAIWLAIVFALLVAMAAYGEYRFVRAHQRAMGLLGVPWDVIDRAYE
ncbi:MAG: hypothetical protein KGM43_11455 [Planctomycetota bacterium]|nr:hypothetical protein [Planctomycetota bacterium]